MLLGQLHGNLLQDCSLITLQSGEQCTASVHDDEAELLVVLEQVVETFGVEFVLASVQERLAWSEWLDVKSNLLLRFVIFHQDNTAEDDQSVFWGLSPDLQLFSG